MTKTIKVIGLVELMRTVYENTKAGNEVLPYSVIGYVPSATLLGAEIGYNDTTAVINGASGAIHTAIEAGKNSDTLNFDVLTESLAILHPMQLSHEYSIEVEGKNEVKTESEVAVESSVIDSEGTSEESDTNVPVTEDNVSESDTETITETTEKEVSDPFDLVHAHSLIKRDLLDYCSEKGVQLTGTERALGKGKLLELLTERYSE